MNVLYGGMFNTPHFPVGSLPYWNSTFVDVDLQRHWDVSVAGVLNSVASNKLGMFLNIDGFNVYIYSEPSFTYNLITYNYSVPSTVQEWASMFAHDSTKPIPGQGVLTSGDRGAMSGLYDNGPNHPWMSNHVNIVQIGPTTVRVSTLGLYGVLDGWGTHNMMQESSFFSNGDFHVVHPLSNGNWPVPASTHPSMPILLPDIIDNRCSIGSRAPAQPVIETEVVTYLPSEDSITSLVDQVTEVGLVVNTLPVVLDLSTEIDQINNRISQTLDAYLGLENEVFSTLSRVVDSANVANQRLIVATEAITSSGG